MARPREFDIADATEGAMNVFWREGYDGASMPALLKGMNLTRGSLYKAFKDKKSLFLLTLERYEAEAVTPALALLGDSTIPNGTERIETLFANVLHAVRSGDRRGCLLCNAAAGPAAYDADIADVVGNLITQMREGFSVALAASPNHANLDDKARGGLAAMLVTNYTGFRILARSHVPIIELEASAAAISATLRQGWH